MANPNIERITGESVDDVLIQLARLGYQEEANLLRTYIDGMRARLFAYMLEDDELEIE